MACRRANAGRDELSHGAPAPPRKCSEAGNAQGQARADSRQTEHMLLRNGRAGCTLLSLDVFAARSTACKSILEGGVRKCSGNLLIVFGESVMFWVARCESSGIFLEYSGNLYALIGDARKIKRCPAMPWNEINRSDTHYNTRRFAENLS